MGNQSFKEVTKEAGIFNSQIGYGLAVAAGDLNLDGYLDLYISNDFHEYDYVYLNQQDGTFKEVTKSVLGHTSRFSMGSDIADFNNDGLLDIVALDMLPLKEEIVKTAVGDDSYDLYTFKSQLGYHHQFARNTLQLNLGIGHDSLPQFTDVSLLANVAATDWSWSPLLCDMDMDG